MSKFKRVWYFQKGFNWMLNENQNVVHLLSFLFSEKKKINSYNNETKIKAMDIKSMEWIIRLLTINSVGTRFLRHKDDVGLVRKGPGQYDL